MERLTQDDESRRLIQSVDAFWSQQIASLGGRYRPPKLVFFMPPVKDTCDVAAALAGPFYCPINESVYLDRAFMQVLVQRFRGGSAAAALGYVVAHEVAHHVQNVIGTTGQVEQARGRSTQEIAQRTLITFELQADCYAGLWMHWAKANGTLEPPADDSVTLEAIAAASQKMQSHLSTGEEMLDPLTQGSAEQRRRWFRRGLDSGQFNQCDTFGAEAAGKL